MSITVQRQLALSDLTSSKRGQTGGIERKPERKRKEIYMSWHRTAHRTYRFEQEEERREKKDSDNNVLSVIANINPSTSHPHHHSHTLKGLKVFISSI